MEKRLTDGRPCFKHKGKAVVAADALAALSGVNFSSVVKVLTALELLREFSQTSTARLACLDDVPLDHAYAPQAGGFRSDAITTLVKDIRATDKLHPLKEALRLDERGQSPYRL